MTDHHDEYWQHPWAVRLSRIVCNDTLTASPAWHDEARGLVMDIELGLSLLTVAKEIAASNEACVICAQTPHRSDCALVAALAKAEGKGQAA